MPIVSGFVVPKMNPTRHDGNIRLLRPMVLTIKHQIDNQTKNDETNGKEKPDEILDIMTEIGTIIFLVPLLNPLAFIGKHFIDLTNMLLHLTCHPLVFFVEHFLNRLPVCISNLDRNLQLGWSLLLHIVDMVVDDVNLTADSVNSIAKCGLSRIVLTDGRLQFKCGIDEGVGCLINVLTQPQIRNL